jgi:hypothetical protein
VFAARLCLRTWWSVTRHHTAEATAWLINWLRKQLLIDEGGKLSPYRLACAALVRALIWPESPRSSEELVLASHLEIDGLFIIQLSQPCCGLIEALPPFVSQETLKLSNE